MKYDHYKKFFEAEGEQLFEVGEYGVMTGFSVEEMYQHFKARLLHELLPPYEGEPVSIEDAIAEYLRMRRRGADVADTFESIDWPMGVHRQD